VAVSPSAVTMASSVVKKMTDPSLDAFEKNAGCSSSAPAWTRSVSSLYVPPESS
jgi:hypothetical protein